MSGHTLKHNSLGKALKGSFFSLGLTIWCRRLSVWLSHKSTNDVSQFSFAAVLRRAKTCRASSKMGSSTSSSGVRRQEVGVRCWGVGLGAGVGGEAGAEGRSGLDMVWGIDEVLGVRGGFG